MAIYPQRYPQRIPQKRKYFVIVVHFGDADVTEKCLRSLNGGHLKPDKVVVVDQGQQAFSTGIPLPLQVIRPQANCGYGAAVNIGLGCLYGTKVDKRDVVIVMNNDVTVYPETLAELDGYFEAHDDALVGVAVEEGRRVVCGGGQINYWTGRAILRSHTSTPLDYIHGAFLAAPFIVFLKSGGFPEKYFMYWEDVLFSRIVQKAGFPLAYASKVRAAHRHHAEERAARTYYLIRNGALFMELETSSFFRTYWRAVNLLRRAYHSLKHKEIAKALKDASCRVTGPRV